jgi:AAA ATPase domain
MAKQGVLTQGLRDQDCSGSGRAARMMGGSRARFAARQELSDALSGILLAPDDMTSVDRPSPPGLVGRDAELDRLRVLVAPAPDESRVLVVVLGEAGMGKTVLLADMVGRAGAAGMRVLSVTGRESESTLAFAAEPLPLTDRLSAIIAAQLGRLPAPIGGDGVPGAAPPAPIAGSRRGIFSGGSRRG